MRALLVFLGVLIGVSLSSSRHWFNPHRIAGRAHLREFPVRLVEPAALDPAAHSGGLTQHTHADDVNSTTVTTLVVRELASASPAPSSSPRPSASRQVQDDLVADTKRAVQELQRLQAAAAQGGEETLGQVVIRSVTPKAKTFSVDDGVVRPGMLEHIMYVHAV